jgi:hypothetical protein
MTREMEVPVADAKKACDTFLRRFRRCPEKSRMPLDEWRLLLWLEALGEDYEDLAGKPSNELKSADKDWEEGRKY